MTSDANFQVTSSSIKKNVELRMALQLPSFNIVHHYRLIDFMIGFFPLKNTQQGNGSIFSMGGFLSFDHLSVCKAKIILKLET